MLCYDTLSPCLPPHVVFSLSVACLVRAQQKPAMDNEGQRGATRSREGQRSLAFRLVYRVGDRTLTDKDIEAVAEKVIAKVTKATGGTLRG